MPYRWYWRFTLCNLVASSYDASHSIDGVLINITVVPRPRRSKLITSLGVSPNPACNHGTGHSCARGKGSCVAIGDHHNFDDVCVRVTSSKEPGPRRDGRGSWHPASLSSDMERLDALAVCVPPLYGTASGFTLQPAWLIRWYTHYHALGATHFMFFTLDDAPLRAVMPIAEAHPDQISVQRLAPAAVQLLQNIWQRGQALILNDCIHRAAARGVGWVLSIDIDEIILAAPHSQLSSFSQITAMMLDQHYDVVSFGSIAAPCSSFDKCIRLGKGGGVAHCLSDSAGPALAPATCPTSHGRRKYLVRARSVLAARIHEVLVCRELSTAKVRRCQVRDLPADEVWMTHANRGVKNVTKKIKYAGCATC